jgi:hypothetical protein
MTTPVDRQLTKYCWRIWYFYCALELSHIFGKDLRKPVTLVFCLDHAWERDWFMLIVVEQSE